MRTSLFSALSILAMTAAGGEGTGGSATGGAPDLVDVDLHGVSVKLPKDQAEKVIAGRQKVKDELRLANERAGGLEAQRAAEAARAEEATRTAEMEKAAKAGEVGKVKELAAQRETKLAARLADRALEASIGKVGTIVPEAVGDLIPQLRTSCRFDLDADTLVVVDAAGRPRLGQDGKPMSVDALIAEHIESRPYLRKASGQPGSGAQGGGEGTQVGTIRRADAQRVTPEQAAAIRTGKLKVID